MKNKISKCQFNTTNTKYVRYNNLLQCFYYFFLKYTEIFKVNKKNLKILQKELI